MTSPAAVPLTSLEKSVSRFLRRTSSFAKIDFSFDGSRQINRKTFAEVAKYIEEGKIHVKVTKDSQGRYDPAQGVKCIFLPADHAAAGTAMVGGFLVHEAVHAHSDITGKAVPVQTDEGCAYIAQTIFQIAKSGAAGFGPEDKPVVDMALFLMKIEGIDNFHDLRNRFIQWLGSRPHSTHGYTGNYEYEGFKQNH